jgi:hypothetical protein
MNSAVRRGVRWGVLSAAALMSALAVFVYVSFRDSPPMHQNEWVEFAGIGLMLIGFPTSLLTEVMPAIIGTPFLVLSPFLNLGLLGAMLGAGVAWLRRK